MKDGDAQESESAQVTESDDSKTEETEETEEIAQKPEELSKSESVTASESNKDKAPEEKTSIVDTEKSDAKIEDVKPSSEAEKPIEKAEGSKPSPEAEKPIEKAEGSKPSPEAEKPIEKAKGSKPSPEAEKPIEMAKESKSTPEQQIPTVNVESAEKDKTESIDEKAEPIPVKTETPNKDFKLNEKARIIARNLLRIYQYLQDDKPIQDENLIKELEIGTPNDVLREKVANLELELETTKEENLALRQSALQIQFEASDQLEQLENDNKTMRKKLQDIKKEVQTEIQTRSAKYQEIIDQLRSKLKETLAKNEQITEVSDAISSLQGRISILFEDNDKLTKDNEEYKAQVLELDTENANPRDEMQKFEAKNNELKQKEKLQAMVIEGYKRNEK